MRWLVLAAGLWTAALVTFSGSRFGVGASFPVSPDYGEEWQETYLNQNLYEPVPVFGPITDGGPPMALAPPSLAEVMEALNSLPSLYYGTLPYEEQRNNVQISIELIREFLDPPHTYPLIGPARLHHVHYKCTVFCTRIHVMAGPWSQTLYDENTREVIHIDHQHFHRIGQVGE